MPAQHVINVRVSVRPHTRYTYLSSLKVSPWVSRFWQWYHGLTLTT